MIVFPIINVILPAYGIFAMKASKLDMIFITFFMVGIVFEGNVSTFNIIITEFTF